MMVYNILLLRLFRGEEILSAIMLGCVEGNQNRHWRLCITWDGWKELFHWQTNELR